MVPTMAMKQTQTSWAFSEQGSEKALGHYITSPGLLGHLEDYGYSKLMLALIVTLLPGYTS